MQAPYDIVIVGAGPAGLSAALALGRGRKRVLLCDSGPRRNAAAEHVHNFVTRDGTPPGELRRIGREQLAPYPSVELRDAGVLAIGGARGSFRVELAAGEVLARRVLLCAGMVDEMLELEGFAELWGRSIFQCPYCHGWELRERRWGYLARNIDALQFPLLLRGWTRDVVCFQTGQFTVPEEARVRLNAAGIRLETRSVARLVGGEGGLEAIELSDGAAVPCSVLFAHPPQRQVDVVGALGLTLDAHGYVEVDRASGETSIPGIYAAGDLTTQRQGAVIAAASATLAAASLNHELTAELAQSGAL